VFVCVGTHFYVYSDVFWDHCDCSFPADSRDPVSSSAECTWVFVASVWVRVQSPHWETRLVDAGASNGGDTGWGAGDAEMQVKTKVESRKRITKTRLSACTGVIPTLV
jgi:hypothetical protein